MPHAADLPPGLRHDAFTVAEARDLGLSPSRLRARDLEKPFRGARSSTPTAGTLTQASLALRLLRDDAFICGPTAAIVHGIPLPLHLRPPLRDLIDVGVPNPNRAPRLAGVQGRKLDIALEYIDSRFGVPVTTPERTWCDLAGFLTLRQMVAAGDFLLFHEHPVCSRSELQAVANTFYRRRGHVLIRQAMPMLSDRSESSPESELRVVVIVNGLPMPLINAPICDARGRVIARADLLFADYKVILEYEGDHHRTDQGQWRRDLSRTAELESLGYIVIRVNADDLRNERALVQRVERHLINRGWTR